MISHSPDINFISLCSNNNWTYALIYHGEFEYWSRTKYYDSIVQNSNYGYPVFKTGDVCYVVNLLRGEKINKIIEDIEEERGKRPELSDEPTAHERLALTFWQDKEDVIKTYKNNSLIGKYGEEIFKYACKSLIPILKGKHIYTKCYNETILLIQFYFYLDFSGKYGVLNKDGKIILNLCFDDVCCNSTSPQRRVDDIRASSDFIVKRDDLYGIMDDKMNCILDCICTDIHWIDKRIFAVRFNNETKFKLFRSDDCFLSDYTFDLDDEDFFDSPNEPNKQIVNCEYYLLRKGNKYGVVNPELRLIIPFEYDGISRWVYTNPLEYKVSKADKFGVIDKNGEILAPCEYSEIVCDYSFPYVYILTKKVDNRIISHVINDNGETIIPATFSKIRAIINPFSGLDGFCVQDPKTEKYGALNIKGDSIISLNYDSPEEAEELFQIALYGTPYISPYRQPARKS
jgi:hypothetical protein